MDNKVYLDEKGYNEFLREIDDLKEEISNIRAKSFSLKEVHIDSDSLQTALDELKMQEIKLKERLIAKQKGLKRIVVVDRVLGSEEVVDINDTVNVLLNGDEMSFTLVTSNPDFDLDVPRISVDSPLGKTVYLKEIGYKGSYSVGNRVTNVEILSKVKNQTLELK